MCSNCWQAFTDAQYAKYTEIENKTTIDIYKVNHSDDIPPSEKQGKIKAIKDAKVASMKAAIPSPQYDKWYDYYSKSEAKKAASQNK